jgi:hypothetical protein
MRSASQTLREPSADLNLRDSGYEDHDSIALVCSADHHVIVANLRHSIPIPLDRGTQESAHNVVVTQDGHRSYGADHLTELADLEIEGFWV